MASTGLPGSHHGRSQSRSRAPTSRPTTPLRPASRSSLQDGYGIASENDPARDAQLSLESCEPAFAELADSMADLEANLMHIQLMHESLSRFSESFASFLYGLNMNAFCVDFPEAPVPESFGRAQEIHDSMAQAAGLARSRPDFEGETTFMTTDTSFVENPPTSSKTSIKFSTPRATSRASRSRGSVSGIARSNGGIARASRGRYPVRSKR